MFAVTTLVFTACLAITGSASPTDVRRNQELGRVITSCTVPNTVALTFDDGPYTYATNIVDILDAANATGTFFFNGDNYACIYDEVASDRVKYAYSHGHQVASFTWSHRDLTAQSWDEIQSEMQRIDDALLKIIGVVPAFNRPPYGNYSDIVRAASSVHKQELVLWDFDPVDALDSPAQSKQLYDDNIAKHPASMLVLIHEFAETVATEVLPYAVEKLQAAGYRLVSVAECVGLAPYQHITAPSARDDTWKC